MQIKSFNSADFTDRINHLIMYLQTLLDEVEEIENYFPYIIEGDQSQVLKYIDDNNIECYYYYEIEEGYNLVVFKNSKDASTFKTVFS